MSILHLEASNRTYSFVKTKKPTMNKEHFNIQLSSNQTPEFVFHTILKVQEWWSGYFGEEFSGKSEQVNDEFSFRAGEGIHYSMQKLVELVPNKKIVWLVTESELSFLEHKEEWTGSKLIFDISEQEGKTQVLFTHEGLSAQCECFEACAPAWTQYLENKLQPLINR